MSKTISQGYKLIGALTLEFYDFETNLNMLWTPS